MLSSQKLFKPTELYFQKTRSSQLTNQLTYLPMNKKKSMSQHPNPNSYQSNLSVNNPTNQIVIWSREKHSRHQTNSHSAQLTNQPNRQSGHQIVNLPKHQPAIWRGGEHTRQPHLGVLQRVALDRNHHTMFVITVPQCTIKWQRLMICRPGIEYAFVHHKERPSQALTVDRFLNRPHRIGPTCWGGGVL